MYKMGLAYKEQYKVVPIFFNCKLNWNAESHVTIMLFVKS